MVVAANLQNVTYDPESPRYANILEKEIEQKETRLRINVQPDPLTCGELTVTTWEEVYLGHTRTCDPRPSRDATTSHIPRS